MRNVKSKVLYSAVFLLGLSLLIVASYSGTFSKDTERDNNFAAIGKVSSSTQNTPISKNNIVPEDSVRNKIQTNSVVTDRVKETKSVVVDYDKILSKNYPTIKYGDSNSLNKFNNEATGYLPYEMIQAINTFYGLSSKDKGEQKWREMMIEVIDSDIHLKMQVNSCVVRTTQIPLDALGALKDIVGNKAENRSRLVGVRKDLGSTLDTMADATKAENYGGGDGIPSTRPYTVIPAKPVVTEDKCDYLEPIAKSVDKLGKAHNLPGYGGSADKRGDWKGKIEAIIADPENGINILDGLSDLEIKKIHELYPIAKGYAIECRSILNNFSSIEDVVESMKEIKDYTKKRDYLFFEEYYGRRVVPDKLNFIEIILATFVSEEAEIRFFTKDGEFIIRQNISESGRPIGIEITYPDGTVENIEPDHFGSQITIYECRLVKVVYEEIDDVEDEGNGFDK